MYILAGKQLINSRFVERFCLLNLDRRESEACRAINILSLRRFG